MSPPRTNRIVIVLLVAGLVVALAVVWKFDLIERFRYYRFDQSTWRSAQPAERYYMAKFLIESGSLIGKTKTEVSSMLGTPQRYSSYNLGPERGSLFAIDDDWLTIYFDPENSNKVVHVFIQPD